MKTVLVPVKLPNKLADEYLKRGELTKFYCVSKKRILIAFWSKKNEK
jgi:hypothetical protein